jgi:hypothetical protein
MRCACGYLREHHDALGKCPLCRCGEPPAAHKPYGKDRACSCACGSPAGAHDLGRALWEGKPCPGRRGSGGAWLLLRQGTYREPDPAPPMREWHGMLRPMSEAEIDAATAPGIELDDAVRPPQVVARSPMGPGEIAGAGGKKQATKLGRVAIAAGWVVEALYWRGGDGTEGCALRFARDPGLRMVALWKRKPGSVGERVGWAADGAYGWRIGSGAFPAKIGHADVERLLGTC